MRYETDNPDPVCDLTSIKQHLRIDGTADDAYLTSLIVAATSFAERAMGCSLITRGIVATFYPGETLSLPRGPVASISSVSAGNVTLNPSTYCLRSIGNTDYLLLNNADTNTTASPLSVSYLAGYGYTSFDVPADIAQVVKCMVGTMFECRESVTDRTYTPVPFIAEFFKLHSREPGVGYRSDVTSLNRLLWRGQTLEIIAVIPDEKRRQLTVEAKVSS